VKNANTKLIGQQPGDMSVLQNQLHLNEVTLSAIKRFNSPQKGRYAEMLLVIGEKAETTQVIRLVPTPVDYWICTTRSRALHHGAQNDARYQAPSRGVLALADSLRKSGLSRRLIYATALVERGAELPTAFLDVCQRLAQKGSSTFLASNVDKTRSGSPSSAR